MNSGRIFLAVGLLLSLPLYFGSYAALVLPGGREISLPSIKKPITKTVHYRLAHEPAAALYWPLEQMDRRLRPRAWDVWVDIPGPGSISFFETSCTFGAEEVTTEASFFELPEEETSEEM